MPIYSLMIGTERLPDRFWDEVGWAGRELFNDFRFLLFYAMRTTDGRIALGGRGAPYHFGSRLSERFERDAVGTGPPALTARRAVPGDRRAAVTHHWGGAVAAPRDWYSSVGLDRHHGHGLGRGLHRRRSRHHEPRRPHAPRPHPGAPSELTGLPWVDHRSRPWEPEPLRWVGVNAALKAMGSADDVRAARTGRPSRRATLVKRLIGA